jgi:hypothetical protein
VRSTVTFDISQEGEKKHPERKEDMVFGPRYEPLGRKEKMKSKEKMKYAIKLQS